MSFLDFLDRIPDKIFPNLKPTMDKDGYLHFPNKLAREGFHIVGSLLYILVAHIFYINNFNIAPYLVFFILVVWITYQEFYLHPKKYNQKLLSGIIDWISWITPFVIYLFILF